MKNVLLVFFYSFNFSFAYLLEVQIKGFPVLRGDSSTEGPNSRVNEALFYYCEHSLFILLKSLVVEDLQKFSPDFQTGSDDVVILGGREFPSIVPEKVNAWRENNFSQVCDCL